jgi:hypothetical protein
MSTWLWCAQIIHALWGTIAMCVAILFFGVASLHSRSLLRFCTVLVRSNRNHHQFYYDHDREGWSSIPQVRERVEALAAELIERHTLSVEEVEQVMWDASVAFTSDRAISSDS